MKGQSKSNKKLIQRMHREDNAKREKLMFVQMKIDKFFSENYVDELLNLGRKKFYAAMDKILHNKKQLPLRELRK